MTMEHRWQTRYTSSVDVEVSRLHEPLGCASLLDVSAGGIGLGCSFGLHVGEVVDVVPPEGGRPARFLVVHVSPQRCGLMLLGASAADEVG